MEPWMRSTRFCATSRRHTDNSPHRVCRIQIVLIDAMFQPLEKVIELEREVSEMV